MAKARKTIEAAEAERGDLTPEEKAIVEPTLKTAREIADSMKKVRDDALLTTVTNEFGDVMGPLSSPGSGSKSRRLSFKGMGTKVAHQMLGQVGEKALAPSGATVVGQEFKPDPVALGQPAHSLLDVVPVVQHATPEFAYLRQTVRTNAAAVVPEGSVKPTSVYTVNPASTRSTRSPTRWRWSCC